MNKDISYLCKQAVEFVTNFFKIYLEDRDFTKVISMCHKEISWIGTGSHEICRNYADAIMLLRQEEGSWDGRFKITDQWYNVLPIDDRFYVVWGEIKMMEDGLNTILMEMNSRFSMICCKEDGEFKLYHSHFSVPNPSQVKDEFVHKTLTADYNKLLEEKLEERTKMLRAKSKELETLANNIYGGVEVCENDKDYTIRYVSDGFVTLTGYSREEIATLCENKHSAFVLPDDLKILQEEIALQLKNSNSFAVEYRIRKRDGSIIWVMDKGVLTHAEDGGTLVQCILMDVTGQKEQEILLEHKSFELETVTNNIQAAIIRCDFDGSFIIRYANDGFFRMVGYTKEEFEQECGNAMLAIIYPDDIAPMNENLAEQLAVGDTTVCVNRLIRRNGAIIWILSKGYVVKNRGEKSEFHGVLTDITEQKNVEEALRFSEKRYEIAMGFSDITMFEYNVATSELILFEKDASLYGIHSVVPDGSESLIKSGIIDADSVEVYREMYRKIHSGAPTAKCSVHTRFADGSLHEFELNLTNVFDSQGKPMRAIGVRKNVTQLRQLQKEMEYGNTMASNQLLIYEINVTRDKIVSRNEEWAREYGVLEVESFSEIKDIIGRTVIEPEYRDALGKKLSKESIVAAFESGQKLISEDYRKKTSTGEVRWFRKNVNIIKDAITGDISIRSYIMDINDEKVKEQKAIEEKRIYDSMRIKDVIAYEVNVTKNLAISGHEGWGELFGIQQTDNFVDMIEAFANKAIHPGDRSQFTTLYAQKSILDAYARGESELVCEYRRPDKTNEYIWVRCTMHLFEDPQNGDIKGYSYVENINAEKQKELELIYRSEHDALTGLYNRATTEKLITDFLSIGEGKAGMHAYFIIDVDYFKLINDNFGHAFGDVVLSQVSAKISELFRDIDIVGRIGGDEFVVFMKNIGSYKAALTKAQEICDKAKDQFVKDGIRYVVSVSIGIAFYSEHGRSYEEFYQNSDTALYISKENGRNRYTVYSDNMTMMDSRTNEIDFNEFLNSKNVEKNIVEYIFRILYESNDKSAAINAALCAVGKSYRVSRVYVYEIVNNASVVKNTFEWCNENITPQITQSQYMPIKEFEEYKRNFNADHIFFVRNVQRADPSVKRLFISRGAESLLQFGIIKDGEYRGFIGFDECTCVRIPSKEEVADLISITNILAMFIMGLRAAEENEAAHQLILAIVNEINSFAYICDPLSYQILYANEKMLSAVPSAKPGQLCFETLANRTTPCEECPMQMGGTNAHNICHATLNSLCFGKNIDVTATRIPWLDGNKICLIIGSDK